MIRASRKILVGGFGTLAVVLAVASIAYACTNFKGKIEVTGNGSNTPPAKVWTGSGTGMNYCTSDTAVEVQDKSDDSTATLSITASPNTALECTNLLSSGVYNVTYLDGGGHNCHSGAGEQIGTLTIAAGVGSGSWSGWKAEPGPGTVCAWNTSNADANEALVNGV